MEKYINRKVSASTQSGNIIGVVHEYDKEKGSICIKRESGQKEYISVLDILTIKLEDSDTASDILPSIGRPIKEAEMYNLFHDAFSIYGPSEDGFMTHISLSLKKFIKESLDTSVKIIVGSDDIFGRIGLCFARSLIGKIKSLSLEIMVSIKDLKTQKYFCMYKNSGGIVSESADTPNIVLIASNRYFCFSSVSSFPGAITIILDVPNESPFPRFTAVGLGFIPENHIVCRGHYYIIDVGLSPYLAQKYGACTDFRTSVMKVSN